jgi:hypothetical protein
MLNSRECYKHAVVQGWKALDNAAREEALQFALALFSLTYYPESPQTTETT